MKILTPGYYAVACFCLALLAGCGSSVTEPLTPLSSAGTQTDQASQTLFSTRYPKLYVGWAGANQIGIYSYRAKTLLRTITQGINGPVAIAFDPGGDLYVANLGNATVSVYASGGTTLIGTISSGLHRPRALIFDSAGNLYPRTRKLLLDLWGWSSSNAEPETT